MKQQKQGPLTEAMFYTLMALSKGDVCGTEIAQRIEQRTKGRVKLGPGTLYTILGKFLDEKLIQEVEVDGRKRTYRITDAGLQIFQGEIDRLRQCLADLEDEQ